MQKSCIHQNSLLKSGISCAYRIASSQSQPGPCRVPSPPATQRRQSHRGYRLPWSLCVSPISEIRDRIISNYDAQQLKRMHQWKIKCGHRKGVKTNPPEQNPHSNQEEATTTNRHNLSHLCLASRLVSTEFPPPSACFASATDDAAAAAPPPPPCEQHAAGISTANGRQRHVAQRHNFRA